MTEDRVQRRLTATLAVIFIGSLLASADVQAAPNAPEIVGQGTTVAVLFLIGTLAMKVTAIVIGYLIVRLGHDTLVRGVTGELDFGFSGSGVETKLKSASPGAAFVLAGAAIIIWALLVEKPFNLEVVPTPTSQASPAKGTDSGIPDGPALPE